MLADALLSATLSARMHEASLTQPMRWTAASGHDWANMFEASSAYKLANGTKGLIDHIAGDVRGEIRLSTPVDGIERNGSGLTVHTRGGETISARAVIVTVPRNALGGIDFRPGLADAKRAVIDQGPAGMGVKVWARVRGDLTGWSGYAGSGSPLNYCGYYGKIGTDNLLVGFGSSPDLLDIEDLDAVTRAVRSWRPDVDVLACDGHDWVADEFSRETWLVQRPGQHRYLEALQQAEGGLFLAGSDYASGWTGYIDGAVESAMTVASRVREHLSAPAPQPIASAL